MSNPQIVIVVAGAQGNLGKLVCEALLARARLAGQDVLVRGLVRKGRTSTPSSPTAAMPTGAADPRLVIEPVDYASDDDLRRVCAGAYAVVSTLQGLEEVIVGVQSRLLKAAIAQNVRRFIPSDFSGDFTKLPEGSHRNFDLRRRFHQAADGIIRQSQAKIEFTSIFQGGFTELLGSGWVLFDYKKRQVGYFGSPDAVMEYTTWQNTAEFAAAVALAPNPTPALPLHRRSTHDPQGGAADRQAGDWGGLCAQTGHADLVARRRDQADEILQTGQAGRGHAVVGGNAIWLL
jgi:hypothetical protein